MRKKLFILMMLMVQLSWSQKYDYIWVRGTGGSQPTPKEYKNSFMDFHTNPPSITVGKHNWPMNNCNACMSDSSGKLLFYTNLIQVYNAQENAMNNGSVINYGKFWINYKESGYPSISCVKIIPIKNDSFYLLIYGSLDKTKALIVNTPIQYAIVDPYYQSGLGNIVKKDIPFHLRNSLDYNLVRHGNGKDWWIILPDATAWDTIQRYYRYRIDQNGKIDSIGEQNFKLHSYIDGLTRISGNGNKLVRYTWGFPDTNIISSFDIDRCTGLLKLNREVYFNKEYNLYGFELSPNGRYMYPSQASVMYQVDLESNDSYLFLDTLGNHDYYTELGGSGFGWSSLTPFDEIMSFSFVSNPKAINFIHKPDLPGQAADFEQHAIIGPVYATSGPQFPNYRLKELSGSPCDTIGFVNINTGWVSDTTAKQLCLIPTISKPFTKLVLRIYDQSGDNILEDQFTSPQTSYCLKTDNLMPGTYNWYLWIDEKKILKGSITKL